MKKFLLVVFVWMVLAMNVCGIAKEIVDYLDDMQEETVDKNYTVVYME